MTDEPQWGSPPLYGYKAQHVQLLLSTARDLIADVSCWTRGRMAEDLSGQSVSLYSDQAARFCAAGALYRMAIRSKGATTEAALDFLNQYAYITSETTGDLIHAGVTVCNDVGGHAAVLRMFDAAIQALDALIVRDVAVEVQPELALV